MVDGLAFPDAAQRAVLHGVVRCRAGVRFFCWATGVPVLRSGMKNAASRPGHVSSGSPIAAAIKPHPLRSWGSLRPRFSPNNLTWTYLISSSVGMHMTNRMGNSLTAILIGALAGVTLVIATNGVAARHRGLSVRAEGHGAQGQPLVLSHRSRDQTQLLVRARRRRQVARVPQFVPEPDLAASRNAAPAGGRERARGSCRNGYRAIERRSHRECAARRRQHRSGFGCTSGGQRAIHGVVTLAGSTGSEHDYSLDAEAGRFQPQA